MSFKQSRKIIFGSGAPSGLQNNGVLHHVKSYCLLINFRNYTEKKVFCLLYIIICLFRLQRSHNIFMEQLFGCTYIDVAALEHLRYCADTPPTHTHTY